MSESSHDCMTTMACLKEFIGKKMLGTGDKLLFRRQSVYRYIEILGIQRINGISSEVKRTFVPFLKKGFSSTGKTCGIQK